MAAEEEVTIENENGSDKCEEKLKKLREELKKCQKERGEYLAGWQRAKADFINARKDEEKAREIFIKFAEEKVLKEILLLADSLEEALAVKYSVVDNAAHIDKKWKEGIKCIYQQLMKILKSHNVVVIECEGKQFNPEEHESVGSVEVEDSAKDQMIVEEVQRGYKLYDRVLRPAKVKVGVYKPKTEN